MTRRVIFSHNFFRTNSITQLFAFVETVMMHYDIIGKIRAACTLLQFLRKIIRYYVIIKSFFVE